MENEEIKKALDKVLDALSEHHEAYMAHEKADNINASNRKILLSCLETDCVTSETGQHDEVFLKEGVKLSLFYRIIKTGNGNKISDLSLNYDKYEYEDFDAKPFEKLESEKAKLISEYYTSLVAKKAADDFRTKLQSRYYSAKEDAIKVLGFRKPIKYRDVIFQVFTTGYYGERSLQMQDAKIKQLD